MSQLALARHGRGSGCRRAFGPPAVREVVAGVVAVTLGLAVAGGASTPALAQPSSSSSTAATVAAASPAVTAPAAVVRAGRSGVLNGVVTDSAGVAIPAAEVIVVAYGIAVRTDEKGAFRLPVLPAGDYTLRVRRIGFHPRTRTLTVQDGESWQMLIELVAAPIALTPVGVTANLSLGKMAAFDRRRQGNVGLFVTREQIAARKAQLLSDVVRTLPGVRFGPGRGGGGAAGRMELRPAPLGGRFDCSPDIYVDGVFAPGLNIDAIPPVDVQGIEVYRGPSDTPVDFRSMNAPCGVVAIWTRDPEDKRVLP